MLKNYWVIAIRNLMRHKIHTGINILGLTIGIASCLIQLATGRSNGQARSKAVLDAAFQLLGLANSPAKHSRRKSGKTTK